MMMSKCEREREDREVTERGYSVPTAESETKKNQGVRNYKKKSS